METSATQKVPVLAASDVFESVRGGLFVAQRASQEIQVSVHMLIELYLDMAQEARVRSLQQRPISFLVITRSRSHVEFLRTWLNDIHAKLKLDVNLRRVLFFVLGSSSEESLRGSTWYSWAVFCDFSVKEPTYGNDPNTMPYLYIRTVQYQESGRWVGLDRNEKVVCHLTEKGMERLLDTSTCPMTVISKKPSQEWRPVTYPAIENLQINPYVRLRKAFER